MRMAALALTAFFCIWLLGCERDIVTASGKVTYLDLEGGFYGIVADDGKKYEPINLPSELTRDGLRVSFKARIRNDLGTYRMWGTVIELIHIERL